jgi:hypothetical protein
MEPLTDRERTFAERCLKASPGRWTAFTVAMVGGLLGCALIIIGAARQLAADEIDFSAFLSTCAVVLILASIFVLRQRAVLSYRLIQKLYGAYLEHDRQDC